MTTPRVSVLLTTFNRERYLAAAIDSVRAQTFSDFELIVSDNCSTDGTLSVARAYAERDARIRVFVNDQNIGQFGNRNQAASLARAELLKYHDSDDIMYPHCLLTMVSMMDQCPGAALGLTSGLAWAGGPCPMVLTPRDAYRREFLGPGAFMCGPSGAIFRSTAFRALGGFEDFGAPSDYLFWLRACAQVPVALLPADLFWYRLHPSQEFQSHAAALEYAGVGRHVWRALEAPDCPLQPDERELARRNVMTKLVKALINDLRGGRFAVARARVTASPPLSAWIRYLRPPQRDPLAGTPLDAAGDYLLPQHRT